MADPNPAILGGTLLPNVQLLSPLVGVALAVVCAKELGS